MSEEDAMLRMIVKCVTSDTEGVCIGTEYKTFDLQHPALEEYLSTGHGYGLPSLVGCEVIKSIAKAALALAEGRTT